MTKSIKNDIYFLKYVFEFSPSYVIGEAIVAIVNGLMPLPGIIISKLLVDGLVYEVSFQKIVFYILVYAALQFAGSFITEFITERYININGHLYAMHFLLMVNRKKTELDLAQLDDPKVHQQAAMAEDLVYKGIGIDMIDNFFTAITSIVSIIATAIVLVYADILLDMGIENWELGQREENIYLTRVLNYYIEIMGDKACAKETRLYGFVSWLMEKYYQTLKALRKRLNKLYNKILKINLTSIILENL